MIDDRLLSNWRCRLCFPRLGPVLEYAGACPHCGLRLCARHQAEHVDGLPTLPLGNWSREHARSDRARAREARVEPAALDSGMRATNIRSAPDAVYDVPAALTVTLAEVEQAVPIQPGLATDSGVVGPTELGQTSVSRRNHRTVSRPCSGDFVDWAPKSLS